MPKCYENINQCLPQSIANSIVLYHACLDSMVPILFSDLNSLCFRCVFPVMFIFFPEQTGEG